MQMVLLATEKDLQKEGCVSIKVNCNCMPYFLVLLLAAIVIYVGFVGYYCLAFFSNCLKWQPDMKLLQ